MKILVPLILIFLSLAFWLAVDQNPDMGRAPSDEEVIHTQERNKVTGQLLNVEIVRCRICGEVISYTQFNLKGQAIYGYAYHHRCGQYGARPLAKYSPLGLSGTYFNFMEWLEKWQKRLSLKR